MNDSTNELSERISALLALGSQADYDVQGQFYQDKFYVDRKLSDMLTVVDDNMLASFIDGTITEEKRMAVLQILATDDDVRALWIRVLANN